jgi:DNA polymerase-3 subunit gamma/tau
MAAQALYLKYRPQTFDEVVGQEPITRTLRNALRQGKLRHAYLLTGPRGTGKTTTARLLAKAVNCHAPEEERPCNVCPICIAITEGRLLDLIEIDAASNRGIDEIRDIREKVGFRPNEGRFKVYVLDEAHMLTEPAFNALLKTLEEPPPHVIFALVTTDPHKIPATISSRCQRFDFRRVPLQAIMDRLSFIAEQEGVSVEPEALELIARQGTGAMRDAISLLDQLTSYGDEITLEQVQMVLGTVAGEAAGKLAACLADGDVAAGLGLINRTVGDGAEPRQFGREVVEYLRGLLLVREGAGTRLLNATAEQEAEMEALARRMPVNRLLRAIRLFNEAATDLRRGLQAVPQLALEMALVESVFADGALTESTSNGGLGARSGSPEQASPVEPSPVTVQPRPGAESTPRPEPVQDAPPNVEPQPEPRRVAEEPPPDLDTTAETARLTSDPVEGPPPVVAGPSSSPAAVDALTLSQVERSWPDVLQAVRQRNPATQAVLNTGCQPVEVAGKEIVVTFPFPFLKDKLGDLKRQVEIQEALSEVLGVDCRLKLVMASDFMPRQQTNPSSPVSAAPATTATPAVSPVEDASSPETTTTEPSPDAQAGDSEVPEELSQWVKERGGQIKIVPE